MRFSHYIAIQKYTKDLRKIFAVGQDPNLFIVQVQAPFEYKSQLRDINNMICVNDHGMAMMLFGEAPVALDAAYKFNMQKKCYEEVACE